MKEYQIKPIGFREACKFVADHHRYLASPRGCLFCVGVHSYLGLVAVAIVGRPISPTQQDGETCEITRLAAIDNWRNASSCAIAASWRVAKALGYTRIISYVDARLNGESFKAAGMKFVLTRPRSGWHGRTLQQPSHATAFTSLFEINAAGHAPCD